MSQNDYFILENCCSFASGVKMFEYFMPHFGIKLFTCTSHLSCYSVCLFLVAVFKRFLNYLSPKL